MTSLEMIMQEYVRLCDYGLNMQEALLTLKSYTDALNADEKQTLSQLIRKWEKESLRLDVPKNVPDTDNLMWVKCSHCDTKNPNKDLSCYNCGHILKCPSSQVNQSMSVDDSKKDVTREYFSSESIMVLTGKNVDLYYELRPQLHGYSLTLGRGLQSDNNNAIVHFDSDEVSALGVSRVHVAVYYEPNAEVLQIKDLDSANGTFINNQKLYSHEKRTLLNGDELRLARMKLAVQYVHPSKVI